MTESDEYTTFHVDFENPTCSIPDCKYINGLGKCVECQPEEGYKFNGNAEYPPQRYDVIAPFLDRKNGVCVPDCTQIENAHLVNPGSGDDNVCQCKDDFIWDSLTQECKSCQDIHYWCDECNASLECTRCRDHWMILSPTKQECWPKINNCQLPLHEQTYSFYQGAGSFLIDDNGYYRCEVCEDGFFWEESTELDIPGDHENNQGHCKPCRDDIEGCAKCLNGEKCIQCDKDFFLTHNQQHCIE